MPEHIHQPLARHWMSLAAVACLLKPDNDLLFMYANVCVCVCFFFLVLLTFSGATTHLFKLTSLNSQRIYLVSL